MFSVVQYVNPEHLRPHKSYVNNLETHLIECCLFRFFLFIVFFFHRIDFSFQSLILSIFHDLISYELRSNDDLNVIRPFL